MTLNEKKRIAIWSGQSLFNRGLVSGTTGNLSFAHDDYIYVTQGGSSFGLLGEDSFSQVSLTGDVMNGKPSKEYPLHLSLFKSDESLQAIVHTHSYYSTLFSCLKNKKLHINKLYSYTPYLKMLSKEKIVFVEYAHPGSEDLFEAFHSKLQQGTVIYVLENHGVFAVAKTMLEAFAIIEEFETSCRLYFDVLKLEQQTSTEFNKIKY